MFNHIWHMLENGISNIKVRMLDTDVIVVCTSSLILILVTVTVGELFQSIVHYLNWENQYIFGFAKGRLGMAAK